MWKLELLKLTEGVRGGGGMFGTSASNARSIIHIINMSDLVHM